ncbi:MAG: non-heme iron oxygenase ferredoxin subunit [bacterium JZ-2024 1]
MKKIPVGSLRDFQQNPVRKIFLDFHPVAIFYIEGKFYAVDDTCTHAQASLSQGEVEGKVVVCPQHGAKFDLTTGEALSLPAVFPVRTYPVAVEADSVFLLVEDKE